MDARRRAGEISFIRIFAFVVDQREIHVAIGQMMGNVIAIFAFAQHRINVLVAEYLFIERTLFFHVFDFEGNVLDRVGHLQSPEFMRRPAPKEGSLNAPPSIVKRIIRMIRLTMESMPASIPLLQAGKNRFIAYLVCFGESLSRPRRHLVRGSGKTGWQRESEQTLGDKLEFNDLDADRPPIWRTTALRNRAGRHP
jgi:hypothetical protein